MIMDFFSKTEDLKERISELKECKNSRSAKEKVKEIIGYLEHNYQKEKVVINDLILSSYMYLKSAKQDSQCLEPLKSKYKIKYKINRENNCSKNSGLADSLRVHRDINQFNFLPPYSFIIKFGFTLEKPYISKDDENFTIIENSIKREKVLKCPYIPGSTWKGCLRSALWQDGKKENDKQIIRIFGNEKAEKNDFRQGRLHFFPSFFSKSDFEVINPHDRKTRTGTNPILIECVPAGESSDFSLLYVPFDLVGKEPIEIKQQMLNDLKLITEGLKVMFTVYGFGAKTSSGYGIASSLVKNGKIYNDLSIKLESETEAIEIPENFKKYYNEDGTVKKELIDEKTGELLSNKKFQEKKSEHGFQSGNKFSKFKRWFEENGESYMNSLSVKDSSENVGEFSSFAELMDLTKAIADANAQPDTAGGNPDE
jgi:CRISPR-associated protein Cmr2